MAETPETRSEPQQRLGKEYEDPHYHDEDDLPPSDDGLPRNAAPPSGRKPVRRIPPPKRRFYED